MSDVLFLDDNHARLAHARELAFGCVCVETADETIQKLSERSWRIVSLDHDLGGETYVDPRDPNTGSAVVRWIMANKPTVGEFIVHSMNTPAANIMVSNLRRAGYVANYVPIYKLGEEHFAEKAS